MEQSLPRKNKKGLVIFLVILVLVIVLFFLLRGNSFGPKTPATLTEEQKSRIMEEINRSSDGPTVTLNEAQRAKLEGEIESSPNTANLTEEQKEQILKEAQRSR